MLLRGFALGFAIAASPGPIFFLCLRRTLLRGWRLGLFSGLGVATADGVYAAIAVFGVAAIATVLSGGSRWLGLIGGAALDPQQLVAGAIGVEVKLNVGIAGDVADLLSRHGVDDE